MSHDVQQERLQAHALLDRLPAAKLGAVRTLLEVMIEEDFDDELTSEDRAAIEAGLASLDQHAGVPMDDILADFGLTMADFEEMSVAPNARPNG